MRVFGTSIYFHLFDDRAPKLVMRQHAPDSAADDAFRMAVKLLAQGDRS